MSTLALASLGPCASASTYPGGPEHVRQVRADVRIEVEDGGGPWISLAPDPSHGRGLGIVRALADDWGITTTPAGRAVWARITWQASGDDGLAQPEEAA
jgi:hypothetical protein